jgi:hypothetical protein
VARLLALRVPLNHRIKVPRHDGAAERSNSIQIRALCIAQSVEGLALHPSDPSGTDDCDIDQATHPLDRAAFFEGTVRQFLDGLGGLSGEDAESTASWLSADTTIPSCVKIAIFKLI